MPRFSDLRAGCESARSSGLRKRLCSPGELASAARAPEPSSGRACRQFPSRHGRAPGTIFRMLRGSLGRDSDLMRMIPGAPHAFSGPGGWFGSASRPCRLASRDFRVPRGKRDPGAAAPWPGSSKTSSGLVRREARRCWAMRRCSWARAIRSRASVRSCIACSRRARLRRTSRMSRSSPILREQPGAHRVQSEG